MPRTHAWPTLSHVPNRQPDEGGTLDDSPASQAVSSPKRIGVWNSGRGMNDGHVQKSFILFFPHVTGSLPKCGMSKRCVRRAPTCRLAITVVRDQPHAARWSSVGQPCPWYTRTRGLCHDSPADLHGTAGGQALGRRLPA